MYDLTSWQWLLAYTGALAIGLAKTGVAGLGVLAVALFANVLPARESTGIVLPLLIFADCLAITTYLRDARWKHIVRLFPWAASGIVIGYMAMGHLDSRQTGRLIGAILIALVAYQYRRSRRAARAADPNAEVPHSPLFTGSVGLLAGFTTMVANAAGPVMTLYLLAMRMPKIQFMGTAAWYFFLLNWFKVPFSQNLGLITRESFLFDMKLAPAVIVGVIAGRLLITRIDQKLFESLALVLALIAGIRLVL